MRFLLCYYKMETQRRGFILLGIIGICLLPGINAGGKEFDMENYCGKEISMVLNSAYQLELELKDKYLYNRAYQWSKTDSNTCEVTVEAWPTTYNKLMLYFDDLDLNCKEGHLEFFDGKDGESRVAGLENNICGDKRPKGVFTVDSRYLRIKYVPSKGQYIKEVFSMIITAYGADKCPSNSHKCDNSRCIDKDIACDDNDSCGDGSGCDGGITGAIIGATVGGLVFLAFLACIVVCCLCCKRKPRKTQGVVQYQHSPVPATVAFTSSGQHQGYNQPVYGVDGSSPYPTNQAYQVDPSGVLPSAPVGTINYGTYQDPTLSPGQLPTSPPPYSDIFGQPKYQAPIHPEKQDHVYADLETGGALPTYDNVKQAS